MGNSGKISEEALSGPVIDRRTTVKLLGAAGITGLAGCTGGGDDNGDKVTAAVAAAAEAGTMAATKRRKSRRTTSAAVG